MKLATHFVLKCIKDHLMIYFHSHFEDEIFILTQKMMPATYHPTHNRTLPAPDQGSQDNFLLLMLCSVFI